LSLSLVWGLIPEHFSAHLLTASGAICQLSLSCPSLEAIYIIGKISKAKFFQI